MNLENTTSVVTPRQIADDVNDRRAYPVAPARSGQQRIEWITSQYVPYYLCPHQRIDDGCHSIVVGDMACERGCGCIENPEQCKKKINHGSIADEEDDTIERIPGTVISVLNIDSGQEPRTIPISHRPSREY